MDLDSTSIQERPRRGAHSRPRRHDIVHEEYPSPGNPSRFRYIKSAAHVFESCPVVGRSSLWNRAPAPAGGLRIEFHFQDPRQRLCNRRGLVVSTPSLAPPMHRHGHHQVDPPFIAKYPQVIPQDPGQKSGQQNPRLLLVSVFQITDQFSSWTAIRARRAGRTESPRQSPAERTLSPLVIGRHAGLRAWAGGRFQRLKGVPADRTQKIPPIRIEGNMAGCAHRRKKPIEHA